jgi:deoxycytidine triphosphate deaminase
VNDTYDIQPASYDLMAGRAVWKDSTKSHTLAEAYFDPALPFERQQTVCLQPGQMLSIVTHEELRLPLEICGTVFSKNGLALKGIFAFNAGHVDPGYEGPIVIRLINLRSSPWTITMGEPVYSIVFHRIEVSDLNKKDLKSRKRITADETLKSVRGFADTALSNALFDLYSSKIETILNESRQATLEAIRADMDRTYVKTGSLLPLLRQTTIELGLVLVVAIAAIIGFGITLLRFGPDLWNSLVK